MRGFPKAQLSTESRVLAGEFAEEDLRLDLPVLQELIDLPRELGDDIEQGLAAIAVGIAEIEL